VIKNPPAQPRANTPRQREFLDLGLSLRKTARELGISHPTLSAFLAGERPPSQPDLAARFRDHCQRRREELQRLNNEPLRLYPRRKENPVLTQVVLAEETLTHFTLTKDPFSHEIADHDDIYELKETQRAERNIMRAVDHAGWVAITGAVGSGKTTLIKKVEARLAKRKEVRVVQPPIIAMPAIRAIHICDAIIADLGDGTGGRGSLQTRALAAARLLQSEHREGKRVVLLFDEAHLLHPEALRALKRFYELNDKFKKLLTIVLIGQPLLARMLKANFELTEVAQRVELYELGMLNGSCGAYLSHKLARAGATGSPFETGAIRAISERADTPLAINNLAAAALESARKLGTKSVSADIVKAVQSAFAL